LNLCDIIVSANRERREFLLRKLEYGHCNRFKVIENFADEKFYKLPHGVMPEKMKSWLGNHMYILAQGGGANRGRYLAEAVEAVMSIKDIKLVIVGPFAKLHSRYNNLDEKVYFAGWVQQFEMVNYIDKAVASIVLYNTDKNNNRLCAANRLYQALSRGVPAVVGSNPPMKSLVKSLRCGVVLQYDGRNIFDISEGIHSLMRDYGDYKKQTVEQKDILTWESQKMTIGTVIGLTAGDLS
jgi:glycosyltransferase involved in cell wall biosynthesis